MKRILIVEHDVSLCLELANLLNEFGFEVGVADTMNRALEMLSEACPVPDLLLVDADLPNGEGQTLGEALKYHPNFCRIVTMSLHDSKVTPTRAPTEIAVAALSLLKLPQLTQLGEILGSIQ